MRTRGFVSRVIPAVPLSSDRSYFELVDPHRTLRMS